MTRPAPADEVGDRVDDLVVKSSSRPTIPSATPSPLTIYAAPAPSRTVRSYHRVVRLELIRVPGVIRGDDGVI
jgi:hypothetical protein